MYCLPAILVFLAAAAFQPVEAQMRSATRPNVPTRVRSPRLCLLIVSVALAALCSSCGVCSPSPFISSISPNNITAGGNQFVLTVNGRDFRHDSSVSWNGSFRITTFISSRQLEAAITAADIAQPGMVHVFVFNPPETSTTSVAGAIGMGTITSCSGKDSNAASFTIGP
jgi:hypothetical protein